MKKIVFLTVLVLLVSVFINYGVYSRGLTSNWEENAMRHQAKIYFEGSLWKTICQIAELPHDPAKIPGSVVGFIPQSRLAARFDNICYVRLAGFEIKPAENGWLLYLYPAAGTRFMDGKLKTICTGSGPHYEGGWYVEYAGKDGIKQQETVFVIKPVNQPE